MNTYHKIQTVFYRDHDNNYKTLLDGVYAKSEFEYLKDCEWEFTEKVDGTNVRLMYTYGKITYKGKSDSAQLPAPLLEHLKQIAEDKLELFEETFRSKDVCLYGEGCGAKIQKGGENYSSEQKFVLFDVGIVIDCAHTLWLGRDSVIHIAEELGLPVVPVIGSGSLQDMVDLVKRGFTSQWGDFIAEGIVARPSVELQTRDGHRIITKLKHKDFN